MIKLIDKKMFAILISQFLFYMGLYGDAIRFDHFLGKSFVKGDQNKYKINLPLFGPTYMYAQSKVLTGVHWLSG